MNDAIAKMISGYKLKNTKDLGRAIREILQELALFGLWRAKFFEHAAFYGGTALRILYKLDRFSEDLDFSLLRHNSRFNPGKFVNAMRDELLAFGFEVETGVKEKSGTSSVISAFLKGDTLKQFFAVQADQGVIRGVPKGQIIRIKLEIDTDPPAGFKTESKYLLQPVPFPIRTYELPDLFAGKMHAVLCREWKNRVKGRDWYDLVWYATHHPKLRLSHLSNRMRQTGHLKGKLTPDYFRELYRNKVVKLDIKSAINEVRPFIINQEILSVWSKDFFLSLLDRLELQ